MYSGENKDIEKKINKEKLKVKFKTDEIIENDVRKKKPDFFTF